jgi:uncharacterized repeat protein (TIGR02543 family)
VSQALTANAFTRTGYTFGGWNTAANGTGTTYSNQQSVSNLRDTAGTFTLFARWTANTVTISWNTNRIPVGSTAPSANPANTSGTFDGTVGTLPTVPTRTGYTFANWFTVSEAAGGTQVTTATVLNATAVSNGTSVTFFARWTAITYTVVFNGNGATGGSMGNQTHTFDASLALTANAFTRTGYTWAHWRNPANGATYTNQQSVSNLANTQGATVNLDAQWTPITYTVVFNGNGATGGSMGNQTHTFDVSQALTANGFSRTNHNFMGWATSATGSVVYTNQQSVVNLRSTTGNFELWAVWQIQIVHYTVVFNGNGNTGGCMGNQVHTVGQSLALTANGFTRTNHTFLGWATSAGGAVVYTNQQQVTNLAAAGGTVALWAVWSSQVTIVGRIWWPRSETTNIQIEFRNADGSLIRRETIRNDSTFIVVAMTQWPNAKSVWWLSENFTSLRFRDRLGPIEAEVRE